MCSVKKKKKKKTLGGGEAETSATAKQRRCQLSAWLTSGNHVSACRHTVSSEDQPSSHSHHPRDQNHRHLRLRKENLTIIVPI